MSVQTPPPPPNTNIIFDLIDSYQGLHEFIFNHESAGKQMIDLLVLCLILRKQLGFEIEKSEIYFNKMEIYEKNRLLQHIIREKDKKKLRIILKTAIFILKDIIASTFETAESFIIGEATPTEKDCQYIIDAIDKYDV